MALSSMPVIAGSANEVDSNSSAMRLSAAILTASMVSTINLRSSNIFDAIKNECTVREVDWLFVTVSFSTSMFAVQKVRR